MTTEARLAQKLLQSYGWYEWICHTNFSFLVGASSPEECVGHAAMYGYRGLSITDYDGVYGLARAHRAWVKQENETSLKLFHGAEVHLAPDHREPLWLQNTLVLVARNYAGYGEMCRILSYGHRHGKSGAHVTLEELTRFDFSNLIALLPMRGMLRWGNVEAWLAQTLKLRELCRGQLHGVLSRHWHPAEDRWIPQVMYHARQLQLPLLFSQDVFFHSSDQKDVSDVLHGIRLNRPVGDVMDHLFVNGERCLKPLADLVHTYRDIGGGGRGSGLRFFEETLARSASLAKSISFDLREIRYHYPQEMLPPGMTPQEFLEKITWESAHQRYGGAVPEKVVVALRHELTLVQELKFADYFLTVWDIVKWARQQDILCQGRGSAANSAICFVLGITSIDPNRFELLFERFISAQRGDPPDIDVDFEHERREEVIQYIYRRYGRDKAAMVANVITLRGRGAIRAVGKALAVPEVVLKHAAKILDRREFRGSPTIEAVQRTELDLSDAEPQLVAEIPWRLWAILSNRIRGFPHHLGIHSGGFVLASHPLDRLVAQEPATMGGRTVIQWCKEDIEALGFFKIDVLALGMLTAVRRSFDLLRRHYGVNIGMADIPEGDQPTYDMIHRADTVGTFQIESRAQMSMLPRLKPNCFYDLVIEVAIIRPGPIQGGMIHPYLRRRNGEEKVAYPDLKLKHILERTLGIPIFQEQVMRIAIAVGGFSPGEADQLRRNMGAWSMKGDLTPFIQKLAAGMRTYGLPEDFAVSLIKQMRGFADYGFPESHAASFALLAYVSSWLKCHYPEVFFTALLNSQPMGFYPPHVLLQVARRAGVEVRPVCARNSSWEATLETVEDSVSKGVRPLAIRLGMHLVRGLSQTGAQALIRDRERRDGWGSWEHFLQGQPLPRDELACLAAANAFVALGIDRRSAQWRAEAAPFAATITEREAPPLWETEGIFDTIQQDFYSTSTSLGPHPTRVIRESYWCFDVPADEVDHAAKLESASQGSQVTVFGMVIVRQSPPTAKGVVFLSLEDETGYVNLILHPHIYRRFVRIVEDSAYVCAVGILQYPPTTRSILVQRFLVPQSRRAKVFPLREQGNVPIESECADLFEISLAATRNYM